MRNPRVIGGVVPYRPAPEKEGGHAMINWSIRWKNKTFWTTLIPALALLGQAVASLFGYTIDLTQTTGKVIAVVDAVFGVLTILGIVVDPTTAGVSDSIRALNYVEPWQDTVENNSIPPDSVESEDFDTLP